MGKGTLAGRKGLRERGREKREEEIHLGLNYCLLEITLGCVSARCCVCLTAGVLTLGSARRLDKADAEIGVSIRHPGGSEGDVR